jgi:membrane protease YdiL (CAAX protease family)
MLVTPLLLAEAVRQWPSPATRFRALAAAAVALGVLFVRRGTIWASFGLHAAFNAVLLILAEVAEQPI